MNRLKEWYLKHPSSLLGILLFFVFLIIGRAILSYPAYLETEIRSIQQREREYVEEFEAIDVHEVETSQHRSLVAFDDYKKKMDRAIRGHVEEAFGGVYDQETYDRLYQAIESDWDSELADTILGMVQRQDAEGGTVYPYISNTGVTMAIGQVNSNNNSVPLLFETAIEIASYRESENLTQEERLALDRSSQQLILTAFYNMDDERIYNLRIQMDEGMGGFKDKYGIERNLDGYHIQSIRPESGYEIQRGHELRILPEDRRSAPAIEPREDGINRDDMD